LIKIGAIWREPTQLRAAPGYARPKCSRHAGNGLSKKSVKAAIALTESIENDFAPDAYEPKAWPKSLCQTVAPGRFFRAQKWPRKS